MPWQIGNAWTIQQSGQNLSQWVGTDGCCGERSKVIAFQYTFLGLDVGTYLPIKQVNGVGMAAFGVIVSSVHNLMSTWAADLVYLVRRVWLVSS